MARSIDLAVASTRGFVPARDDEERFLMRHVEDLARTAYMRGVSKHTSFLSDREQQLAAAALNRAEAEEGTFRFDGGWSGAERRVLCIEPDGCYRNSPLHCIRLQGRVSATEHVPEHRDYLGSLMGLKLRREALGDIILPPDEPGVAYVFALESAVQPICNELVCVGATNVTAQLLTEDETPAFQEMKHKKCTATVSSLRLDAVLAALLHCSRGQAAALIAAGRVEINHLSTESAHETVYADDVFTVRGKGRYRLVSLLGKSKKDRQIIEYFQY